MPDVILQLEILLGLLAVVAALALLGRAVKVHYSIVLVLAGLVLGWIPGLPRVQLPSELFLLFILPPLLYPAALQMPWWDFRGNIRSISLLALGLVLFTMLGIGWIAHVCIPGLPWSSAFVLGAIVAPTDPLAATAIARRMNVPQRIERVLEGESLVNDSTGLVGYRIAMVAVLTGSFSLGNAALEFLKMTGGGIAFGLALAWVIAKIQRRINDPAIEVTISLLTPFAAYLPAEKLGMSGVLAVVSAGMYIGWQNPLIHEAQTRLRAKPFWEMIQFILNGLVFLLVGLELPEIIHDIANVSAFTLAWEAALISAAVIVIRIVWVFPAAYLPRLFSRRLRERDPFPDWQHVAVVAWTGLRGAVSLSAALALPRLRHDGTPFPGRATIEFLTYCVILATLVAQGLSLPLVIRWLKISGGNKSEREEADARLAANKAALDRLEELEGKESDDVLNRLKSEYADRISQLEARTEHANAESRAAGSENYQRLRHEALQTERNTLLDLRKRHEVDDEVLQRILHELDVAEAQLQS